MRGIGLFEGPPRLEGAEASPQPRRESRWSWVVAALVAACLFGVLGWVLPTPGGSLIVPTAIVAGVGVGIAVGGATFLRLRGATGRPGLFAGSIVLLGVLASVWTFQFSLPTQMALDTGASSQAEQALLQVQRGRTNPDGVPLHPCRVVRSGNIGPLTAPYTQCATSTGVAAFGRTRVNFVFFTPVETRLRGLAYTNFGPATFLDECYRHLVGDWWMFNQGDPTNPAVPCPIGYKFHGGP